MAPDGTALKYDANAEVIGGATNDYYWARHTNTNEIYNTSHELWPF